MDDMRQLVRISRDAPANILEEEAVRSNVLNKRSRARAADEYRRIYLPRFVNGPIPNAWRLVRPLEIAKAPIQTVRPVYYWISAKAEPLLEDFCREFILPKQAIARSGIGAEEVIHWLEDKGCPWSDVVTTKVARGLLAALRDFGILEGGNRKRLASILLPLPAFAYLARCLRETGAVSRSLMTHSDWQLFLLTPADVERFFLLAHQDHLLEFHAAGSTVSINFPVESLEEYAHVVTRRPL